MLQVLLELEFSSERLLTRHSLGCRRPRAPMSAFWASMARSAPPDGCLGPGAKPHNRAILENLAEYSYLECIAADRQNRPCLMTGMATGFRHRRMNQNKSREILCRLLPLIIL